MTLNWGNRLLLTFVVFAGFMMYLVYRCIHTNYDLVTKDYYKEELAYQQVIDGTNRANLLSNKVLLQQENKTVTLQLPGEMKGLPVKGTILFYCASDARRDKQLDLLTNNEGKQIIDVSKMIPGNYSVKVSWDWKGLNYYSEELFKVN